MQPPIETDETPRCQICRTMIPADAPLGQCPSCLMDCAERFAPGEQDDAAFGELPRIFGDYELLRQIGCGGMGVVYEARHIPSERRVALKMIRPDLASRKFLRRFVIEGEAAARLDHPGLIPIYEIKEDGSESFFSMELIEGETLKEKIRQRIYACGRGVVKGDTTAGHWHEQSIACLMADVARAVHHAHERGVFHRDLKPGNILIDTDGRPHIADFGVAKILADEERAEAQSTLTVAGATLGTPEYMPPECASGSHLGTAAALAAADIYSLGAILYELLTSQAPFSGNSHLEILQKVREGDLRRPRAIHPKVARDLETICLKCMEKNPRARYTTAGALADDLDRWLEGKPILARATSVPVRVRRWLKRNPVGAALIFSLLFGLGVSLGFVAALADRMRTAEINKALERETYVQKINDWWALPAITNLVLPSALLAEIRDQPPRTPVPGHDVLLKFGMSVAQDPITRAYGVASHLGELETRMSRHLGRTVVIDLHISKTTHLESELLSARQADFQRLDALSFLRARAKDPGIVPVAIENDADEIVFCVLQNSGISNLTQLAGRSVGFGDMNSAATVLAQYSLWTNQIRQSDLKSLEYFTSVSVVSKTQLPQFGSAEIITDMREVKSGREALRHLLQGDVDAAVTVKRYFETRRYRGSGLRLIGRIPGVPEVFAARSGLDPAVVRAFQNAMLSFRQSPGLGTLSSFRTVTGVIAADDSHLEGLRMALTNVQQHFGNGPDLSVNGPRAVRP